MRRKFALSRNLIPRILAVGFLFIFLFQATVNCQELEPRALTNLPTGMNFLLVGYSYSQGDLLLDPGLPIEDLNGKLHTVFGAYLRSIKLFGLAGKVDIVAPWASGDWKGFYTGIDTSRSVSGMGDLRFRLSLNFLGSPALKLNKFSEYQPAKISGVSLQVIAPTGQYDPERLINLGSNRWAFKPQWGFARYMRNWIIETYLSAWFYSKNNDFWGGNELTQKPLGAIKIHFIRSFQKKWWVAFSTGYAFGGKTYLNGEEKDTRISTIRLGLNLGVPIGPHHTIRLTGFSGIRLERGSDFDAIVLSYQYRWIK